MNKDAKIILAAAAMLVMMGIVMIYSSSAVYAYENYNDSAYFVKKHMIYLLAGLVCAVFCMSIPIGMVQDNAKWIMFFSIILLTTVLIPGVGREAGGARRWLQFSGYGFQPSEAARLAVILYLADVTSRRRHIMWNFKLGFFPCALVIGIIALVILAEPDMGMFISILVIGFGMLYITGVRLKHLAFIFSAILPVLFCAVILAPYRMKRILIFLNPWSDPRGAGFQLVQSFIALGSGGPVGVGLGMSKQKLFYLPASHTDFIFSIIGEELGFLGTGFVLFLFIALIFFCFKMSFKIQNRFSSYAVFGISLMIAFEVIVNIGVSLGMLPTKGLPLPFISYGGSSLVAHFSAMGLIFNMAKDSAI